MSLLKITPRVTPIYEAVEYDGRSSTAAALQNWINNDVYVKPKIVTNDISNKELIIGNKRSPIAYHDYVIRIAKGNFIVINKTAFDAIFNVV